jgi:putative aldouronate transport system permease protein
VGRGDMSKASMNKTWKGSSLDLNAKKNSRIGLLQDISRNPLSYLLALPALIYTFIYGYATLPYILIAFQKFSYTTGIFGSDWIGFDNFKFFFASSEVWQVTWNTVRLNVLFLLSNTIFSLAVAVLLNEVRSKWFLRISQSTFLFPHFLSWIIASYIIYILFSTQNGLINSFMVSLGMEPFHWYNNPKPWNWILVLIYLWKNAGYQIIIYLAAITSIDHSYYEAAMVDGATRLQRMLHVTIPLMMPTVAILTILALGRIFQGDFSMIYAIVKDNGMLFPTTDVIDTYVFRAFRLTGDPAEATAIGLYQGVVGFCLVFLVNRIVKKLYPEGALF